jgi:hypothetical protein
VTDKQFLTLCLFLIAACITALILLPKPEPPQPKIPYMMEVPTHANQRI